MFCWQVTLSASNIRFDTIPESLKKDANAIIRYENYEFIADSETNASLKVKYAVTILNKSGDKFANCYVFYDKFITIKNIKGAVYNSLGEITKKLSIKDFSDQSITGYSGYDDNRIKYYEAYEKKYPYTVEYEYEVKNNGFISIPRWQPIDSYKIAVENSSYTIKLKDKDNFHYKLVNLDQNPQISTDGAYTTYHWEVKNLNAVEYEPYGQYLSDRTPLIYFAPNKFYFDGYDGNQQSWEELGKWAYQLSINRDQLPLATIDEVLEITNKTESKIEKVKLLYEYMQSKTRYVSIQLGIGGFQPFTAIEVDNTGFGDCKALSNYMFSLLKAANIKSHYAIIGAGEDTKDLMLDFPSINQMNHAIVCVPMENDTIWLECTSQTNPFGYLSTFTDDRYAVLIKPEGGQLVRTTKYDQDINSLINVAQVELTESGNIKAKSNSCYSALQYDFIEDQFYESTEDQKKNLYKDMDLANLQIIDFSYNQKKDIIPQAWENIEFNVNNYSSISGSRLFLPLNLLNKQSYVPKKVKDRKSDIELDFAYSDFDTITYLLPESYAVEFLPDTTHLISPFGEYKSYVIYEGNTLKYIRTNKGKQGKFPKESYPDLIQFFKDIRKADKQKAILIKKNS